MSSKWITFQEAVPKPKTKVWHVLSRDQQASLGIVQWHGPWRRYAFFPYGFCVFEEQCLRDVAEFCEGKTREHRERQKPNSTEQ